MSTAVIDIGKTNAKVVLIDREGRETDARRRANAVLPGPPYPHLDAEGLWSFVIDALRAFAPRISAIVPVTHGACAALVDAGGGLALPVLDYEHDAPGMREGYDPSPFPETGSPPLPGGLNLGVQLHWLERTRPDGFARAVHLLTWPQWWAFRLTGVAASEVTSLGCHTDLWEPWTGRPSGLARRRGWDRLLPPLRRADAVLGHVRGSVAAATGLDPSVPVHAGIHDSNASLLPYLGGAPCAVVSTGTWVVVMALGGGAPALDPERDMLLNVAADGRPVPTARFMGGRAREAAIRAGADPAEADRAAARRTAERLADLGAAGPIFVEGPFAASRTFLRALEAETGRTVRAGVDASGTAAGASILRRGLSD